MKTVLITGANKGIGFETARQLAQLGYFVYLGSRDRTKGLDALKKLNSAGISNVAMIEMDVTNIHSIKQAKQELENKTEMLDVLINNAGISGAQPQNLSSGEMENLRKVFETNFFGVVQTTQQFLGLLKKSKSPCIINVSSELGSLTIHSRPGQNPNWTNFDAYSCSKTALNAFTVMLASEFRQSTQQHIHDKLIGKAKEKLSTTDLTVSEIAYELGFEHPQSFSKLFKTKTNFSPLEFRQSFN